jgi:peptide/nickel transport system ATP-binding protein
MSVPSADTARSASGADSALLQVRDLNVQFATEDGIVRAVDGVDLTVRAGQSVGIVGESGSGKSVSMLTIMGLSRSRNATITGTATFEGKELLDASDAELREIRGDDIAMIFQDPLSSLHPFYKVGWQLIEAVRTHRDVSKAQARERAIELLGLVGIPSPRERINGYPHEFSGGMRQRAMIAMALANDPKLLIADEPTTALDVTVQAQILELIARLQQELNMALVLITHDLGVVAQVTEEVNVMYAGEVVERAPTDRIFAAPQHPYTWGLLRSIPRLDRPRNEPLVPIPGRPPSLIAPPKGCRFYPRCPYEPDEARSIHPDLETAADEPGHLVRCHLSAATRQEIWARLKAGASPEQVKRSLSVETGAG